MEIIIERLNEVMKKEDVNENILASLTRKNIYSDIIEGKYSDKDIYDVASVLGVKDTELCSESVSLSTGSLAINLYSEIEKAGFSLRCFSDYTGISIGSLSYYQHGKSTPSENNLNRLCYGLNCSVDYILGNSDDRGKSSLSDYHSKKMVKVSSKIGDIIKSGEISPSKLAKRIGIPYNMLKKVIAAGGYIPSTAIEIFCNIYKISSDKFIYQSDTFTNTIIEKPIPKKENMKSVKKEETKQKELDDLLEQDKRQREMKRIADDLAKENASKKSTARLEVDRKVASLASPKDDKISLNQLSAIVEIMSRRPELIYTFVDMCNIGDDDFNHIHDSLKWMLSKVIDEDGDE